jgi:hypothetical protein
VQQVERHVRVSERRRSREEMIAAGVDKPYVRPSRAPRDRTDGRATDVEIAHCEKLLRDLRCGIVNLREFHSRDYDFNKQLRAQAAKIRSVEKKLFGLRQARLR